jgi:polyvinyl alcohol dehydrogenase (cytochrome)
MFSTGYFGRQVRPRHGARKVAFVILAIATASATLAVTGGGPDWGMIGNDSANSRNQPHERTIGVANVGDLAPKWVALTAGDVSATPAVVDGAVYFGDFGGMEWKLDAATGYVIWSHKVSDYTGIAGEIARTSPSVAGNTLIIGSLMRPLMWVSTRQPAT